MSWAYRQSPSGWVVFKGDTSFWPDQFGRVRSLSYGVPGSDRHVDFARLEPALAAARKAYPPDHTGRYSYRGSEIRGRFCEALVAVLNAADAAGARS